MKQKFILVAATAIAGAAAGSADATTWTMTFTNVTPSSIVGINYNGESPN